MKIINQYQIIRRAGILLTTTWILIGSSAKAATIWDGMYLEVIGGFHGLSSGDVKQAGATSEGSYDGGFLAGMAIGKELTPAWSLELEWFYRSNEVDSLNGGVFGGVKDGDFASTNLMLNAIYTFSRESSGEGFFDNISPYVGLGIGGVQELDIDMTVLGVDQEYSDNWVPSAQIIVGATYPINESFSAFGELRYHFSGSSTLEAETGGLEVDAAYNGYSALFGIRYSF
jgi:opacity protein-like surface antigen